MEPSAWRRRLERVSAGRTANQAGTSFNHVPGRPTGRCDTLAHSVFYEFRTNAWRHSAETDARVTLAMSKELSRISEISIEQMARRALDSMRGRVVRQLLDPSP